MSAFHLLRTFSHLIASKQEDDPYRTDGADNVEVVAVNQRLQEKLQDDDALEGRIKFGRKAAGN